MNKLLLTLCCTLLASLPLRSAQALEDDGYEMLDAIKTGDTGKLEALFLKGFDVNYGEGLPLQLAAEYDQTAIIQLLLTKDGINVNASNDEHESPLISAVTSRHRQAVNALLMDKRVDVNQVDGSGRSPLYGIVFQYWLEKQSSALIDRSNTVQKSDALSILKDLLQHQNIDCNKQCSIDGNLSEGGELSPYPLTLAAEIYWADAVRALLNHPKIDTSVLDWLGYLDKRTMDS